MTKRFLRLLPICVLLCLTSCTGRSDHWLSLLEQAEEMNRNDVPFTSDSLGLALVRHYDHWWHSPYLRLRAYYMLGSAYRDMGEAPAAIHYYNIATEQVDTVHADSAIYATLFRVYGQMAMIYGQQNMPIEELNAWGKYSRYSFNAKDTINYILGYERMVGPYYEMDSTAQVLCITEKARLLYRKYGLQQQAARVYPTAIYVYLQQKDWDKARLYMTAFERESGLFDDDGNIAKGRELYYDAKGKYYLGIHKLDSAEYFYRKLALTHYKYESSDGLLSIYSEKKYMDSILKYSKLSKDALLQWATDRQAEAVIQSSAMYRYERNQNIASQRAQEAKKAKLINLCLTILVLLIVFFVYLAYRYAQKRKYKKEQELLEITNRYNEIKKEFLRKSDEYTLLLQNNEIITRTEKDKNKELAKKNQAALLEKDKEIKLLQSAIAEYEIRLGISSLSEKEEGIEKYIVVKNCRAWVEQKGRIAPTKNDMEKIIQLYAKYYPYIFQLLTTAKLSHQELLVCVLMIMGFDTGQIVRLLDKSSQSITNSKTIANYKLFGEKRADVLLRNLKKLVLCNPM